MVLNMEYKVKINEFEGPLDLLLHLIKESKVEIWDVKIEEIVEQYLDYINAMKEMNLDIASSYLVMASELIELKSKLLLPNSKKEETEEEEIDPREALINRLVEYQKYKELTKEFKELETERKDIHTKIPESLKEFQEEGTVVNSDVSLDDLMEAFQKLLQRKELDKPLKTNVTTREISIEERRTSIKNILKIKKKVDFFELFEEATREYIVVTFLTILEMAKKRELVIKQENNFDNIICEVIE